MPVHAAIPIRRPLPRIGAAFLSLALGIALASAATASPPTRMVTCGADLTAIVCALGAADSLVGVDDSSGSPEAQGLPRVGYKRALSAEGLLSLRPDLVVATHDAGPPSVFDRLADARVEVLQLTEAKTVDATATRILEIGRSLGKESEARARVQSLRADLEAVRVRLEPLTPEDRPRVLFVYGRGGGSMSISGTDTAADEMIRLAGGRNAVEGYSGYKPMTAEAVVAANPDMLLLTEQGLRDLGGRDALLGIPGVRQTAAGRSVRIVTIDEMRLLGFGPDLPRGVEELAGKLHPDSFGHAPRAEREP